MFPLPLACVFPLVLSAAPGDGANALHLDVLEGSVRVLAGETWLRLDRGCELPGPSAHATLSLEWNARARLTVAGADVELRGPLEVESTLEADWSLRVSGSGEAQVSARSTSVQFEVASTARLELCRGVYWIEGIPAGGWRVGCHAGEPLLLRPPAGVGWDGAPQVACGQSLRLIPAGVAPPPIARAGRRLAVPAWKNFSWPWARSDVRE